MPKLPRRRHDDARSLWRRSGRHRWLRDGAAARRVLVERLFEPGRIAFAYTHVDRMIVGGACPTGEPLSFGDGADIGTPICSPPARWASPISAAQEGERRQQRFALANRDVLYIGRGAKQVTLESTAPRTRLVLYELGSGRRRHRASADHEIRGETARTRRGATRQQAPTCACTFIPKSRLPVCC